VRASEVRLITNGGLQRARGRRLRVLLRAAMGGELDELTLRIGRGSLRDRILDSRSLKKETRGKGERFPSSTSNQGRRPKNYQNDETLVPG